MVNITISGGLGNNAQAVLMALGGAMAVLGTQFALMQTVTVQGAVAAFCVAVCFGIKEYLGDAPSSTATTGVAK